jgi:hypothetical protein
MSFPSNDELRDRLLALPMTPATTKVYEASCTRVFRLLDGRSLHEWLAADPHQLIDTLSVQSVATQKLNVQLLVKANTALGLFPADHPASKAILHRFTMLKMMTQDLAENRDDIVPTWDHLTAQIDTLYGPRSKQALIIALYRECSCRDDFGQMIVCTLDKRPREGNYLLLQGTLGRVFIRSHKTQAKGCLEYPLTRALTTRVTEYMAANFITVGRPLFDEKQLSACVARITARAGYAKGGGINLLRRMHASKSATGPVAERATSALQMGHGHDAHKLYTRPIGV